MQKKRKVKSTPLRELRDDIRTGLSEEAIKQSEISGI